MRSRATAVTSSYPARACDPCRRPRFAARPSLPCDLLTLARMDQTPPFANRPFVLAIARPPYQCLVALRCRDPLAARADRSQDLLSACSPLRDRRGVNPHRYRHAYCKLRGVRDAAGTDSRHWSREVFP